MLVKDYLRQAYRLDLKINSDIEEVAQLREMAASLTPPVLGDKVQTTRVGEATFVRSIEKVLMLEEKINQEIDALVALKDQMRSVIDTVPHADERMVLRYRYIHNMTWEQIGRKLKADRTTVYRWHERGLAHVRMPDDPIWI